MTNWQTTSEEDVRKALLELMGKTVQDKGHRYPGVIGDELVHTSNCENACGAWMGGYNSGAPDGIDPFNECPKWERNPLRLDPPLDHNLIAEAQGLLKTDQEWNTYINLALGYDSRHSRPWYPLDVKRYAVASALDKARAILTVLKGER